VIEILNSADPLVPVIPDAEPVLADPVEAVAPVALALVLLAAWEVVVNPVVPVVPVVAGGKQGNLVTLSPYPQLINCDGFSEE